MTSTIKKTTLKTSDNATLVSYPLSDGSTVYDVILYPNTMDETIFNCVNLKHAARLCFEVNDCVGIKVSFQRF